MADERKAKGNAAFLAGCFEEAALTVAIALAPNNHILYSNRSAARASLHRYADALADAQKTIELRPDWAEGYSRLGTAPPPSLSLPTRRASRLSPITRASRSGSRTPRRSGRR